MSCIITGCELVVTFEGYHIHGDLFDEGSSYIFNAEGCKREYVGPTKLLEILATCKALRVNGNNYFEKRGLYVINKHAARLNHKAQEYINEH